MDDVDLEANKRYNNFVIKNNLLRKLAPHTLFEVAKNTSFICKNACNCSKAQSLNYTKITIQFDSIELIKIVLLFSILLAMLGTLGTILFYKVNNRIGAI